LLIQKVLSEEGLLYAAPNQTWTKEAISAIKVHNRKNKVAAPMCSMTPQNFGSLSKKMQDTLEKQIEIKQNTDLGEDKLDNIDKEVEEALNSVVTQVIEPETTQETETTKTETIQETETTKTETTQETETTETIQETETTETTQETETKIGELNALQFALSKLKKKS